jgi:hypothetical protein
VGEVKVVIQLLALDSAPPAESESEGGRFGGWGYADHAHQIRGVGVGVGELVGVLLIRCFDGATICRAQVVPVVAPDSVINGGKRVECGRARLRSIGCQKTTRINQKTSRINQKNKQNQSENMQNQSENMQNQSENNQNQSENKKQNQSEDKQNQSESIRK